MRKKILGLGLVLALGLGVTNVAAVGSGSETVKGMQFWMHVVGVLEEGNTIKWDLSSTTTCGRAGGEEFDLYITTESEYKKARTTGSDAYNDPDAWLSRWTAYVGLMETSSSKGSFEVPIADTWVLFVYMSGGCTSELTYDISVSTGIPGFTLLPTILSLGMLCIVIAIHKRNRRH